MDKPQGDRKLGPVGKTHSPLHNLLLRTWVHKPRGPDSGPTDLGRRNCLDPEPRPGLTAAPQA